MELARARAEWHGIAVKRVAVFILGLAALGLALFGTLGAAVLVPLGMLVVSVYARRRGRAITRGQSWLARVMPFGVIVTVGLMGAVVVGPWRGKYDDFQRSIIAADNKPHAQPALDEGVEPCAECAATRTDRPRGGDAARGLQPAPDGAVLVPTMGSVAWAGTSFLVYGLHGPRAATADPVLEAFARERER